MLNLSLKIVYPLTCSLIGYSFPLLVDWIHDKIEKQATKITLYCLPTFLPPLAEFFFGWKRGSLRPLSFSWTWFKSVMVKTYLNDAYFKNWSYKLTSQPGGRFFHHHLPSSGSKGFVRPHGRRLPSLLLFCLSVVSDSLRPHGLQPTRLPCPSLSLRVCSNWCPPSRWCYLTISSSALPFSFCLQCFPVSGSFPMSQLFPSGG